MRVNNLHRWDVSFSEARAIQERLRELVRFSGFSGEFEIVAGVDVAYSKRNNLLFGGLVALRYPNFSVVEEQFIVDEVRFPYVPGYLSFREAPVILRLFEKAEVVPDVVIIDGQGVAHPRGFGIASHIGVLLGVPTIGCAKSLLCGEFNELGSKKGSVAPIYLNGKICGYAVRTKTNKNPVFVSPGNLISFADACDVVLKCVRRYRIPEPTRVAHIMVNMYKREFEG